MGAFMMQVTTYVLRVFGVVFFCVFSCVSYGQAESPVISVISRVPLLLSVSVKGETFAVSPSQQFMRDVFEMYEDVSVEDITGDGVAEVFFRLEGRGANACYKVNRPGFSRHLASSLRNAFQTLPVTADC
jgi:hypothetical protein